MSSNWPFADAASVLRVSECLVAIGIAQMSLEWIFTLMGARARSDPSHLVVEARYPWLAGLAVTKLIARPIPLALAVCRLVLSLALLGAPNHGDLRVGLLATLAVANLLFAATPPGVSPDGGEMIARVVVVELLFARLAESERVTSMCIWAMAVQACIAYCVPGLAKLLDPGWRDGRYLAGILRSRVHGHPRAGALLDRHPTWAKVGARAIIAWETAFPIVLVLPRPAAVAYLAMGVLFHVSNGAVMGLSTFTAPFLASYPAILYCSR